MGVREAAVESYEAAMPALSVSVLGGLFAGVVLGGMRPELRAVPGLLVLVPALLATRGMVYGSLGARLSTALHQGLIEPRVRTDDRRLGVATAAALANGVVASGFAAVVAWAVLVVLGLPRAGPVTLVAVALLAGLLSGIALTAAVVVVVFVGYRRGLDPDTLVGPLVTTIGDVFGIALLLLSVRVVLAV